MLKENVNNYFDTLKELNENKELLKSLKEKFEQDNKLLISEIENLNSKLIELKCNATEEALEEFDGINKKLYGGIGIRETKKLSYDETKAFKWAKEKDMFLQLDKKVFEKAAPSLNLDFVETNTINTVTFPKELKV